MVIDLFVSNLGDALWLTPLARYSPSLTIRMRAGDKRAVATAPIFNEIASVEFIESPSATPISNTVEHVTQRLLREHGFSGKPSIPNVKLSYPEMIWGRDFTKNWINPVVIVNENTGTSTPDNVRAHYVRGNPANMQEICNWLKSNGYTPIQFGPAADFYDVDIFQPLNGAVHVRGLSVRDLAAAFWSIGGIISSDTGLYHLMLAVGGNAFVLVPDHSDQLGYQNWNLHYDKVCWGAEPSRVWYVNHRHYYKVMEDLKC